MKWLILLRYKLKLFNGWYRTRLGLCPVCNSDAPELYDCPLCEGRHQARGDKFPPSIEVKNYWWDEYRYICEIWLDTQMKVLESKQSRV